MKQIFRLYTSGVLKKSNPYYVSFFLVLFLFGNIQKGIAQKKMEKLPGPIIVCPANFEDQHSRMAMQQLATKKSLFATKKNTTADIQITFGPGAQNNPDVQAAFQFAIDIWAQEIISSVPIRISADFQNLGNGVLASAGPTQIFQNFTNAPEQDVFYPSALANTLAREILDPDEPFDLIVNIGNGIPWYFGTDGNTPAGQFDFVTVALHEMGHGLGFFDGGNVDNATGIGTLGFGEGIPVIFDTFVVDGDENSVLDLPNPSIELGSFFTSGDVFLNGPATVNALGGNLAELFAPNPFQGGSSIAHWDEATFPAGDINSLMTPQVGPSESNFDIGPITRGHFSDMGWQIASQSPITFSPSTINEEILIEQTVTREITVTNISDTASTLEVFQPTDPFTIVSNISPSSLEIAAGTSEIITIELSTVGIPKGVYEDNIEFNVSDFDRTLNIPVSIRVLDGTEAPSIVINPESFDETLDQFLLVTRNLTLENVGDDELNYNITINGENQSTFKNRVALTKTAITENGFKSEKLFTSSNNGLASAILKKDRLVNKLVSTIYATGFEEFNLGELNMQEGWGSAPVGFNVISDTNAFEEAQHIRGVSDGSGVLGLAFSPLITQGNDPFTVATARLSIQTTGSNFEFIPQSTVDGSVVTRVRFNADGSIDVLDAASSAFESTGATTPEGYFEIRLIVDRDNSRINVFLDDNLIYSGTGFASSIDQIVLLSDNATAGSIFDTDTIEVIDGDENAFFLSVSPISGTIDEGDDQTLQVLFDTRTLAPGAYNATINILSDDPENPAIDVPVNLTVTIPPTITVAPDSLSASVDVITDIPPVANRTFTISNSGESPLDFSAIPGPTVFTPPTSLAAKKSIADLDMKHYGVGNTEKGIYVTSKKKINRLKIKSKSLEIQEKATTLTDSIFYDTGISFPDSFGGVDGSALTTAVRYDVDRDFTLTAVRNAYRTETQIDVSIILEIYRGGTDPSNAELLSQQTITTLSETGIFDVVQLTTPQVFVPGDVFWIVHKYPDTITFPQGQDDDTSNVRPNTYFFSTDGGATFTNLNNFIFLTRALSGAIEDPFITLEPSSGSIAPGESIDVEVTFDGTNLANGTHSTNILINSNDPITPTANVATTFEVSGQVNEIEVTEELLLFDNVFIGNTTERTFTIINNGLGVLTVSDIASDNPDFTVSSDSAIIQAGDEIEVTVSFAPTTTGNINGIISITSDGSNSTFSEIIVNGVGVSPPIAVLTPEEIFESTDEGTTIETEVTLRNDGEAPLIFSFPEIAAANILADPDVQLNDTSLITFDGFNPNQQKGFLDQRQGHLVEFSIGTDVQFGYSWIDSDEDGGPVYVPFDISTEGTEVTELTGGDSSVEIELPFPFAFYGTVYESIFVNANGLVSFQATPLTFINSQIPSNDFANNLIAGFWTDIEPQEGNGSVHVATSDDVMVIQWSNAQLFLGSEDDTVSFKILLYPNNTIEIYYDDVDDASFNAQGTVGIENADGTDGAQVAFNTPYIKNGLAVRFMPPDVANVDFISDISNTSGVIPAGGSRTLSVTLDATNLIPGKYLDQLVVSSNAPDKSTSTSDIELTVNAIPEVTGFTLVNAITDTEIGPLNDGDVVNLYEIGTDRLNIVANVNDAVVGSVVFDYNGEEGFSTENVAPYAIGGDRNGDFRPFIFDIGPNTITATPFSEARGGGNPGVADTINFNVITGTEMLNLVNADTNEVIRALSSGDTLDLNDYVATPLSVHAETKLSNFRSIVFDFNGVSRFQVENIAPYALAGGPRNSSTPVTFIPGTNTITANVHRSRRGLGPIIGSITVAFEVIPEQTTTELFTVKVYPNPITDSVSFITIENDSNQELSATLFNMLGQLVYTEEDFNIVNGNIILKTTQLPKGAYILQLTDTNKKIISNKKIMRQ